MVSVGNRWRKSSYSGGNGGECVQIAAVPRTVLIRDSKNPDGPELAFGSKTWAAFAAKVKADARSGVGSR
jgi:hypothetical protein